MQPDFFINLIRHIHRLKSSVSFDLWIIALLSSLFLPAMARLRCQPGSKWLVFTLPVLFGNLELFVYWWYHSDVMLCRLCVMRFGNWGAVIPRRWPRLPSTGGTWLTSVTECWKYIYTTLHHFVSFSLDQQRGILGHILLSCRHCRVIVYTSF